jgi:hypothetical protein
MLATRFDRIALSAATALIGAALVEVLWPHALEGGEVPPDREDATQLVAPGAYPAQRARRHGAAAVVSSIGSRTSLRRR